jgi:uncharacterized protein YukE
MAQAIADPEELIRFAQTLKQFNGQIKQSMSVLNGQFNQLGQTWRDQEHQKFAQEYLQTMKVIERFLNTSEQHAPFLIRKAQRIRDYLNQK